MAGQNICYYCDVIVMPFDSPTLKARDEMNEGNGASVRTPSWLNWLPTAVLSIGLILVLLSILSLAWASNSKQDNVANAHSLDMEMFNFRVTLTNRVESGENVNWLSFINTLVGLALCTIALLLYRERRLDRLYLDEYNERNATSCKQKCRLILASLYSMFDRWREIQIHTGTRPPETEEDSETHDE